jgi:hypothetical protein
MTETIQPVVVAIDVRRGIEQAFRVFTTEIGAWWPVAGLDALRAYLEGLWGQALASYRQTAEGGTEPTEEKGER